MRNCRAEVMFGTGTERYQRVRIGDRQTPSVEADDVLKLGNRLLSRVPHPLHASEYL